MSDDDGLPEPPELDRYAEFFLNLPEAKRLEYSRALHEYVTRDAGGWTIQNQTADDYLRRHRQFLRSIIMDQCGDPFGEYD